MQCLLFSSRGYSSRLAGMGSLSLAVEDESNELNLYDFGFNVAGLIEDDSNYSLIEGEGSYYQEKEEGDDRVRFFPSKGIGNETTYRTSKMAFSLEPYYRDWSLQEVYSTSNKSYERNFKFPEFSLSGAYKLPWFTIGEEFEMSWDYEKKNDSINYKKNDDIKKIITGISSNPIKIIRGNLILGFTFAYQIQEMQSSTGISKTEGIQAIYSLEDRLKVGINSGITQMTSSGWLKNVDIRGVYSIKSGENKINIGSEFDFTAGNNAYMSYEYKTIEYRGGIFYSYAQKVGLGIEFLVDKNPFGMNQENEKDWCTEILVGGEFNIKKYFYLRSGYNMENIFQASPSLEVIQPIESYTAGLGIKMRNFKLDIAYKFGSRNFYDTYYSSNGYYLNSTFNTIRLAATFYPWKK